MSPTTFHMLFAFSWSVDKNLRKALAPFCVNVRSLNFFRQTDEVFLKNILVSYAHGYSKQAYFATIAV